MHPKIKSSIKRILKCIQAVYVILTKPLRKSKTCCHKTLRCAQDPTSKNYKYELLGGDTPPCCRKHLMTILGTLIKILDLNEVPYIATYGTHLGAVRHGDLIPWDTDIDIAILSDYRHKTLTLLNELEILGYRIETSGELTRLFFGEKNNLHVDIEFWTLAKTTCFWNDDIYVGRREVSVHYFFEVALYKFGQLSIKCPKDTNILTEIYGKGWEAKGIKKWAVFNRVSHIF